MASYIYNGDADLVFPTLFDANGNVLVVKPGDTFDGPDGLSADGVSVATANIGSKAKASASPDVTPNVASTPDTSSESSN